MNKRVYELPIASTYVHNWGIADAIREIMQNAIDSETDGNKLSIRYNNGSLTIANTGCNLDISDLVLGSTSKHDPAKYIGTYGEGFKLALVVLLRNNILVKILTNGQQWIPEFRKSVKFKTDTLHIDVYPVHYKPVNEISFEIMGIDHELFDKIRRNNLAMSKALGYSIGETLSTEYGDILLDARYKGMMFVNGLYVQSDSSFQYGYNFKPEFLQLDRDRRAIGYYKMRELTAKAVTSQKDVKLAYTAITRSYVDVRDIVEHMNEVSKEFKVDFANSFIKQHNLDEDTFVGLEKEVKASGKPKTYKTDSKAIAELVNAGLGKNEEYREIKIKVQELSKVEEAENDYKGSHFEKLIDYLYEHRAAFDADDLVATIRSLDDLHTSHFELIEETVFAQFYEEVEENE